MINDLLRVANYGANIFSSSFGIATDPGQLQAISAEQMEEYQRRQGDPTNVPWELRMQAQMLGRSLSPVRKPTMTLAEYDAMRAAFKPR